MTPRRKNALLIALYLAAGAILAALLALEFRRDRFGDCMSTGAFSKEACEEYARE
jgi:hypothetical protein